MPSPIRVAILGATGAVGTELLELLESRQFPLADLTLLSSPRSAGKLLQFRGENLTVQAVEASSFKNCDLVLASAGGGTSKAWADTIKAAGAVMVDNSSAFRMQSDVPLVVPEINAEAAATHQGIIANPNCTTILMGVAIYPLHRIQPIQRIVVS
ncbi:MAG: aspartate-semialdehyde dehydrogenase, partial [Synechocystis sp.]|nr:aspartate-semialdehyde dehydrogenase [Synechocystis sp.]